MKKQAFLNVFLWKNQFQYSMFKYEIFLFFWLDVCNVHLFSDIYDTIR
jgi:hypothetical protein